MLDDDLLEVQKPALTLGIGNHDMAGSKFKSCRSDQKIIMKSQPCAGFFYDDGIWAHYYSQ